MSRKLCLPLLLWCCLLSWAGTAAAQVGPKETVEAANQRLQKLLSQKVAPDTPAAGQRDKQLQQVVTELLDLDVMAEKALGRYWNDRSAAERQEYLSLMRQLVERSYLRQARSHADYQVAFGTVELDPARNEAQVSSTITVTKRGRQEQIEVVYTLTQRPSQWRVIDIETDGASTVRNYRAQFQRIIQQNGFGELLARMRRRLDEGASEL